METHTHTKKYEKNNKVTINLTIALQKEKHFN